MTKRWKQGGTLAEFREDGTLHIYAPDDSRVMSSELAADLAAFLMNNLYATSDIRESIKRGVVDVEAGNVKPLPEAIEIPTVEIVAGPGDTVPSGEITTTKRRPGRPRKAQP